MMTEEMDDFDVCKEEIPNDVLIHVTYTKIHDIDTVNQRFRAELLIESRWHDSSLRSTSDYAAIQWRPELFVENAVDEPREETVAVKIVEDKQTNLLMVSEMRRIKGLFHETLELADFPLDVQELSVTVCSKKSIKRVNLVPLQPEMTRMSKIVSHLDKSAWYLHDMVTINRESVVREYSFGQREYPAVRISCQAFRSPGYFYWNALLPIVLISFAALGPFVADHKSSASRLPATATMLLSAVSFKTAVTRLLPTVSYLTSMDKYSLASIVLVTLMFVYHAFFSACSHFLMYETLAYLVDKLAFLCFLGLVVGLQVVYGLWLLNVYNRRHQIIVSSQFRMASSDEFSSIQSLVSSSLDDEDLENKKKE
jgi:hypothetical protein